MRVGRSRKGVKTLLWITKSYRIITKSFATCDIDKFPPCFFGIPIYVDMTKPLVEIYPNRGVTSIES